MGYIYIYIIWTINGILLAGWWYTYPSEQYYEFVSWDGYSQLNGRINNVPNHQPARVTDLSENFNLFNDCIYVPNYRNILWDI